MLFKRTKPKDKKSLQVTFYAGSKPASIHKSKGKTAIFGGATRGARNPNRKVAFTNACVAII